MSKEHHYEVQWVWTGNQETGTSSNRSYVRDYEISADGKPPTQASPDHQFRADPKRSNREHILVSALAACHMLWYLHLCSAANVVVVAYTDSPQGTMLENPDGSAEFTSVVLHPQVELAPGSDLEKAYSVHSEAHHFCALARSVNFPVTCDPTISVHFTA